MTKTATHRGLTSPPSRPAGGLRRNAAGDGYDDECQQGLRQRPSRRRRGCDDGNTNNTDDCTGDCRAATCGDGVTEPALKPAMTATGPVR